MTSDSEKKIKKTLANTPADQWDVEERLKVIRSVKVLMAKVPVEHAPDVVADLIKYLTGAREKAWQTLGGLRGINPAYVEGPRYPDVVAQAAQPPDPRQTTIDDRIGGGHTQIDQSREVRQALVADAEAGRVGGFVSTGPSAA